MHATRNHGAMFPHLLPRPLPGLTCDELSARLGFCRHAVFRGAQDFFDLLVALETLQRDSEGRYTPHPRNLHLLLSGSSSSLTGILALNNDRCYPRSGLPCLRKAALQDRRSFALVIAGRTHSSSTWRCERSGACMHACMHACGPYVMQHVITFSLTRAIMRVHA